MKDSVVWTLSTGRKKKEWNAEIDIVNTMGEAVLGVDEEFLMKKLETLSLFTETLEEIFCSLYRHIYSSQETRSSNIQMATVVLFCLTKIGCKVPSLKYRIGRLFDRYLVDEREDERTTSSVVIQRIRELRRLLEFPRYSKF